MYVLINWWWYSRQNTSLSTLSHLDGCNDDDDDDDDDNASSVKHYKLTTAIIRT